MTHYTFYPFIVISNVVECLRKKVPGITYVIVAINSRSLTGFSLFFFSFSKSIRQKYTAGHVTEEPQSVNASVRKT